MANNRMLGREVGLGKAKHMRWGAPAMSFVGAFVIAGLSAGGGFAPQGFGSAPMWMGFAVASLQAAMGARLWWSYRCLVDQAWMSSEGLWIERDGHRQWIEWGSVASIEGDRYTNARLVRVGFKTKSGDFAVWAIAPKMEKALWPGQRSELCSHLESARAAGVGKLIKA